MIIKTFRADTSTAALKMVRSEMGGEAVIIAEAITGLIHIVASLAKANNVKEEELQAKLKEAFAEAKKRDPENLPDLGG